MNRLCDVTTHPEADSTSTVKRWMMGQALSDDLRIRVLKASAAAIVSSAGCGSVRRWDFDSDPLDSKSKRGRTDIPTAGLEAPIGRG
jgi:hypothetical protein